MESELTTYKRVEGYKWKVTFNEKVEIETTVEVVDEKGIESRKDLNLACVADLNRHKQVVLY